MWSGSIKCCSKCRTIKNLSGFDHNKASKDGYFTRCKLCRKIEQILYYSKTKKNKSEYYQNYKSQIAKRKKKYYLVNKEKIADKNSQYYQANKEKLKAASRKYFKTNYTTIRIKKRAYIKNRLQNDHIFKLTAQIRNRIKEAINKGYKKTSTIKLLGCTIIEVKQYLESKFKPGMNWNNHGNFGWHIDHIKPCSGFDLTKERMQQECFHYTNLQPLWWKDNLIKSNNI